MSTSIFFTESKDFKLIKDRILNQEDNYLVYVYADTSNIRIPRELIMELPKYGNNLIWVDIVDMDASDLSHHMVLTIGQLINPEEEIDFYIVSKSSKFEKTVIFLKNQGVPAELIAPLESEEKSKETKGTGRRGRPKKVQDQEAVPVKTGRRGRPKKVQEVITPVVENVEAPKKKRGRPAAVKAVVAETIPAEPKKRGRKKKEVTVVAQQAIVEEKPKRGRKPGPKKEEAEKVKLVKEVKPAKAAKPTKEAKPVMAAKAEKAKKVAKTPKAPKEAKARKQRVDKEITNEMVQEKLSQYPTADSNLSMVMSNLFGLKKVARPKFVAKLIDAIKLITLDDDTVAEKIIAQLQDLKIIESQGAGGRVLYKD